jgi:hypothetical protein
MLRLAVVVPTLDEAGAIEPTLQALQAAARARRTGGGGRWRQRRRHAGAGAAPGRRGDQAPRGRAAQMNAGARPQAAMATCCCSCTPTPRCRRTRIASCCRRWPAAATSGAASTCASRAGPLMLRVVAALMNLRSRWSGIATGDQALFMTRAAFDAVGGFPDQPLMEDIEMSPPPARLVAPGLPARARDHLGPALGERGVWRTIVLMWRLRWPTGAAPRRSAGAALRMTKQAVHPPNAPRVVVFAKAPLPGRAKTRLIPALGAEGAARLARRMLDHALAQALASAAGGPGDSCASTRDTAHAPVQASCRTHTRWLSAAGRRRPGRAHATC